MSTESTPARQGIPRIESIKVENYRALKKIELKTRGQTGPISFELKYREQPGMPVITYRLAIDEGPKGPEVVEEWLQWRRGQKGKPFRFLEFSRGKGRAASGESPDEDNQREEVNLRSPDLIAVNTLGQLSDHPRIAALREFITDWYVSYLSIDQTRHQPEAGPQERLSKSGENLANVVQYLATPGAAGTDLQSTAPAHSSLGTGRSLAHAGWAFAAAD